jgi:hypothetical protein
VIPDRFTAASPVYTPDPVNWHAALNAGLVAWWLGLPSSDGGTQLWDLCGINHGGLSNFGSGNGWQPTARAGGWTQLKCNGTNSTVQIPNGSTVANGSPLSVTGAALTFGGWIFPTVSNAYQVVLLKAGVGQTRQYALYLNAAGTGFVYVVLNGASLSGSLAVSPTWSTNAWNHIFLTYNGATVTIYINGVSASATACTGNIAEVSNSAVYLGYDSINSSFPLSGYLDDMRVYNRCLSSQEMANLYNESRQGYPTLLNRLRPAGTLFAAPPPPTGSPYSSRSPAVLRPHWRPIQGPAVTTVYG